VSVTEVSYVDAQGIHTRVRRAGEGSPVVVLHGWGGRLESMVPVADCLHDRFLTVALDLPGFGESQMPPEVWGSEEYARHVAAVLDSIGIARAHCVGHSFGAKAALCLAAARPDMVDKLVVVASPGLRTPPSLEARIKRTMSRGARSVGRLGAPGRALRDAMYRRVASRDYRDAGELRPILVRVVNEDLADVLTKIASPTLLVWGADDEDVPVAVARRMERLIPDAGLVTLEGAGHFCYLDQPARFCRIVRHFFLGEEAR
jgi:pimeloyl-ACP methyl ester carboxylesterase